jgi:hypothetical protein
MSLNGKWGLICTFVKYCAHTDLCQPIQSHSLVTQASVYVHTGACHLSAKELHISIVEDDIITRQ